MSTTVTYKGNVLTIVNNQTRVMLTSGKYMEDNVTLTDVTITPSLETKSVTITPTESSQSQTILPTPPTYDGLSSVAITVDPISSTYVGSGITRRSSSDLTVSGDTVSAPAGYYENAVSKSVASGTEGTPVATKGAVSNHSVSITPSVTNVAGYISGGSHSGTPVSVSASELVSGNLSISANGSGIDVTNYATVSVSVSPTLRSVTKSYTPTESSQSETITPGTGYDGLSSVAITVNAISPTYVGSGITRQSSLSVSGASVTAPAGYYENPVTVTITSGSAATPATAITANPTISIDSSGLITASVSASQSVTPTVSAGYVSSGTAGTVSVSGSGTHQLTTQGATTITPSASQQTAVSSGTYVTGNIIVDPIPLGSAGTPTATKGTVSNHSITVTPSVTNTTGYITGSTITGTGVVVDASELVSGNLPITSNGNNIDVTNYATVSVNVAGQSKNVQIASGVNRVATTTYTAVSGQSLTVAKTGTYNVYWSGYRSSTSGTSGSQLYIGNTAYGNAQTTFSNNGQSVHLSNVSLTQNQTITVRARSRNTSSYMYVANLTIVEV